MSRTLGDSREKPDVRARRHAITRGIGTGPAISLCLVTLVSILALTAVGVGSASAASKHATKHGSTAKPKWKVVNVSDPNKFVNVSCPSTKLCVGIDLGGNAFISTDPTGAASTWKTTDIDGTNGATAISCPTVHLCVAVDGNGNAIVSTNPTGGAAAWTSAEVDTVFYNSLDDVSCPSPKLCVAVDTSGDVVTSTNPTGGAAAWVTTPNVDPEPPNGNPDANSLDAIDCPTTTLCVAGDFSGNILTSTNPTGAATAWSIAPVESMSDIGSVSCPTAHFCMAVGHSDVWRSTNPTGGTSSWKRTYLQIPLDDATCQSTKLCVAEDVANDVLSTSDPAGPAKGWVISLVGRTSNHLGGGVACPSSKLCVAVGEDKVITSTDP